MMNLTILGSSSALPTSERNPSAHVLNVHERFYLIDCGEGTQLQLKRYHIRFSRINHIFISHLHGDHVFGLYGLLSTFSLMGRVAPIHIYAPENYEAMLATHLADFDIRLSYEIDFIPLKGNDPAKILDTKYLTVTSFPLVHRIPSYGFLFTEKPHDRNITREAIIKYSIPVGRIQSIKKGADFELKDGSIIPNSDMTTDPPEPLSFAYCSDTKYFKRLPSFIKGASLLYHEATFGKDKSELAAITGHSTTVDAANVAKEAGVKKLIIGHFSARYDNPDQLVEEARSVFPDTWAAEDGKSYDAGSIEPF